MTWHFDLVHRIAGVWHRSIFTPFSNHGQVTIRFHVLRCMLNLKSVVFLAPNGRDVKIKDSSAVILAGLKVIFVGV